MWWWLILSTRNRNLQSTFNRVVGFSIAQRFSSNVQSIFALAFAQILLFSFVFSLRSLCMVVCQSDYLSCIPTPSNPHPNSSTMSQQQRSYYSGNSGTTSSGSQHGTNSAGNHYCTRGESSASGGAYHYSNTNGSYYYQNASGSTYYVKSPLIHPE